jgi:hypothetical protein
MDIRSAVAGLYIDDLSVRVGGDVGGAWTSAGEGPLLADAVLTFRMSAAVADQAWDSVVQIARGFGQPDPTGDWTDSPYDLGKTRIVVGLGSGW